LKEVEEAVYLKNELRNYYILKRWVKENISPGLDGRIAYYEGKIRDIDIVLSSGNSKGIDYNYVPTSAVSEPLLTLLAEQEELINRYKELVDLKEKAIEGHVRTIEYIEECLNRLNEDWKKQFIIDYYCNNITTDNLSKKYNYTSRTLRMYKESIIREMISTTEMNNVL
jgi:hypothetical protein